MTKNVYPVVIEMDRYGGCYSGAKWHAWNLQSVPDGASSGDVECSMFWDSNDEPVGKGNTPDEAYADLLNKFIKSQY